MMKSSSQDEAPFGQYPGPAHTAVCYKESVGLGTDSLESRLHPGPASTVHGVSDDRNLVGKSGIFALYGSGIEGGRVPR